MDKRSLHRKLDSIRQHVVPEPTGTEPPDFPDRYRLLADRLGGETIRNHAGAFCFVRRHYSLCYTHGDIPLSDLLARTDLPASAFTAAADPARLPIADIRFFDLETIGLGGAGTMAFLIGIGSLVDDGFEVRQYLIPDFDDESAVLEALHTEFTDTAILASYNGAAFDLPILRDRFIVNRVGRDIPRARHVDLLHGVRRLFRRRLRDCSLGNIEREVFNFARVGDIPGYLVPSAYFDWLSSQRLDDMEAVLEHNRLDIVSLYFLAAMLADVFESIGERLDQIDDLHSLSRIFHRRRELDTVTALNVRVESIGGESLPPDVLLFHAAAHKRRGEYEQAVGLWQQLAELDFNEHSRFSDELSERKLAAISFRALLELAIYHEHRTKDYATALACTNRAARFPGLSPSRCRSLDLRRARLTRKLNS